MTMMTIRELLRTKESNEVWWVTPTASLHEALQKMSEKDIGALLILDNGKLVGIFSERDYAREVIQKEEFLLDTPVQEFMTAQIITITQNHTIEECTTLMTQHHIRHLPVMEEGCLVGMVSIGDIVRSIITSQAKLINSLENYIIGTDFTTP